MPTIQKRPLSPHLGVYRLPLTALLSISHRISGVLLSLGLILLLYILFAVAGGEDNYTRMQALFSKWPLQILIWGFILALCLHLFHGLRHLIWDAGESFERENLGRYASYECLSSLLLFLFIYLIF
jgi:succinate dehydrogenase / fumarate reductase, cytochrome b subunit